MAHALVHTPDQHQERRSRGQRQIAEDRKTKSKGDRHAREHAEAGDADKEDDEVEIAERLQKRLRQPEQADDHGYRNRRGQHQPEIAVADQPEQREQRHQAGADRQGRGAPGVGNLQRRRGDEALLVGVFVAGMDDEKQESERRTGRDHLQIGPQLRSGARNQRRHAHVLGAAERHHRAQHGQPQEQDRRQFIRPDQRRMQHVTGHHPGEQDHDLGDDQQRRRDFHQVAEDVLERCEPRTAARGCQPPRRPRQHSLR